MVDTLLVALGLASIVSVGLLFLPAFVELKKPKDAGPRLITKTFEKTPLRHLETDLPIENDSKLEG